MFSFFSMAGNYEDRKIERSEYTWGFISTARVTDASKPYETGIQHEDYGDSVIVVEAYDTISEAKAGHKRWIKTMSGKLPDKLVNVGTSEIAQLASAFGAKLEKKRKPKK